ncbi:TonB-dependent receptor [Tsuneonella sp. HG249]
MIRRTATAAGFRASRRIVALSTASAIALAAQPVLAQDAEPEEEAAQATPEAEDENVITVTGFRQSLESAQNIKQAADTVVDVITAEDIGALPDRSVAEALQRVPGVNIGRFAKPSDPDRFSVEGAGVVVRGLPFVRSELNGRDIFSATGGRELSFNDVSPELLGRIEVFKNVTADMIEGGIAGTVNLVTRRPLDKSGFHIAATVEANYGDMAKEWSPGFSVLASNTFETGIGTFGVQLGYAQQELVTSTDASQITDPCYRAATLTATCIRVRSVGSGGFGGGGGFNETNFPPPGAVVVPKGAGVRTSTLTRDRDAINGTLQWESNDGRATVTLEYLRATTDSTLDEAAILAQVNDDALFPVAATGGGFTFDANGIFQTGTLTNVGGAGIPTEFLRFQRAEDAKTEDFSIDIDLAPTDRLRFNAEVQYIRSDRNYDAILAATQTFTDIRIDAGGETPSVEFLQPGTTSSSAAYFTDPTKTYYWFLLDSAGQNEGNLTTVRFDGEFDISDTGFFKQARFGARWGDRERINRDTNFSNWGNLGAPWTGRNGNWNCDDFQAFGCGGAYVADFPSFASARNPFGDSFQRGNAPIPVGDGSALFFGGDDLLGEYLDGTVEQRRRQIVAFTLTPEQRVPIYDRTATLIDGSIVNCDPFCPGEISDVEESTTGGYVRVDFGTEFGGGIKLDGNIGVRYVETEIRTRGLFGFPDPRALGLAPGTVVTVPLLRARCANAAPGTPGLEYCQLTDARLATFAAGFTGEVVTDNVNTKFDDWLPSLNLKLDFGNGMLLRGAVSKGIVRPDLGAYRAGGTIGSNVATLAAGGTLATGPLFAISGGNRLLRPVSAWSYDLSAEWYFDTVGSITVAAFLKDIKDLTSNGAEVRQYTSPGGVTNDVEFRGPFNTDGGTLKGVEVAYQQTYDFLPGILSGLGSQLTYTYVDAGDFRNTFLEAAGSFAASQPLAGVSKHTVNAVLFYEKGRVSARAAYNWRSEFLITPRDDIFPFSPIWGEDTGQLDASIFFSITDQIKLGVQGVNLLDEVTRTSQVIDFDGTRVTRSAFRNDRRYTFLARFSF